MGYDDRLVKKGMHEPREGLAQQGRVQVALAKQHATELGRHGWTAGETEELSKQVQLISSGRAAQAESRAASRAATRGEHEAVGDAKSFINRLRTAMPLAVADAVNAGVEVSEGDFHAGHTLGRSTPKILGYLDKIEGAVGRLDAYFKPYLGGEKPAKRLAELRSALAKKDTAQEVALENLPGETLEIYQAKGRALELIERVNRIAALAFYGQAEIVAKFNKDLLLRARRTRGAAETPAATTPGSPPPPVTPPSVG